MRSFFNKKDNNGKADHTTAEAAGASFNPAESSETQELEAEADGMLDDPSYPAEGGAAASTVVGEE